MYHVYCVYYVYHVYCVYHVYYVYCVYYGYFKVILGDHDKSRTPHTVCYLCVEDLRMWYEGKTQGPSDLVFQ